MPLPRFHRLLASSLLVASVGACTARTHAVGTDELHTIDYGGRRSYVLHLPTTVPRGTPVPLVVNLHGGGGNATSAQEQTGFDAEADRHGFIVVYPNGTGAPHPLLNALGRGEFLTWNAGTCCGYAAEHHVDDVGFIRALVAALERRYPIDRRRIYATGISNGGMMAYRLACEMSDTFAAIGVVSGTLTAESCRPAQPVAVIHFHGTADANVPLDGGIGAKSLDRTPKPPVIDAITFWARRDGASPQPVVTRAGDVTRFVYADAHGRAEVVLYLIRGGGHAWPGGKRLLPVLDPPTTQVSATPLIWRFFAAHPKP